MTDRYQLGDMIYGGDFRLRQWVMLGRGNSGSQRGHGIDSGTVGDVERGRSEEGE